jgi:hypothetical protein
LISNKETISMRNSSKFALLILAALALTVPVHAQVATTLSGAIDSQTRTFSVASTSGIPAGYGLVLDNEVLIVASVPSSKQLAVAPRGSYGTIAVPHKTGTMVLAAPANAFIKYVPAGTCSAGSGLFYNTTILITTDSGNAGAQWVCSSVTGKIVPGFGNGTVPSAPTAAVASAAGAITPSGLIFHVTGTAAITGFSIPVGFDPTEGATVCAIPDGLWTTTAVGNIAVASTAVVSKVLCWAYDPGTGKFYPFY